MAKIALIVGGARSNYQVGLDEIISQLSWRENQVVLATLSLRANTTIEWNEEDAKQLQEWACEI